MSDFIEGCTICGKTFEAGDEAYATINGEISKPFGDRIVFEPSEAPYLTVACEDCGIKCSEAIANINKKEEKLYAGSWSIADIHERRADNDLPAWTDKQAHDFLEYHEEELSEAMCQTGWGLIDLGLAI